MGNLDRDGTLLVVDDLRQVDFGGGLRFPIRWVYRSSDQSANAYGWEGFALTMIESKAVKKTEALYEVTMLSGRVEYFSKGIGEESDIWKNNGTQWTGVEDGDKFTITRWDGWKMEFKDGRIRKLVTDDHRTILWTRDSTDPRLVTSVAESGYDPAIVVEISNDPLKMYGSSTLRGAHKLTVNGDVYTFSYSGGTLQDIAFPDGRKTQWRFENNGENTAEKRLTLTGPGGFWDSWVYFDETRLLKTDDVWSYSMTGGSPGEDGVVYNRPTMQRTRMATGETEKLEYMDSNSLHVFTDVQGNVTRTYYYKVSGRLYGKPYKIEYKKDGENSFSPTWRGTYDAATGDVIRSFDAEDNETEYEYERFSGASEFVPPKKISITDPLGRTSIVERDQQGNVVETTSPAGIKRKMEYDNRNRLIKVKNESNETLIRYVYGDKDQVLEAYDALTNKTTYEYILHLGNPLLKKTTTPEGRVMEWSHDAQGRVTGVKRPSLSEWQYTYSGTHIGMADKVTDPLSGEMEYLYDSRLATIRITDPMGREVEKEYNDLLLPVEVKDALGQVTKLQYNAYGDVTKVTDARNKEYLMRWNGDGQREELKWPDNVKQEMIFDAEGKLASFKPRGTESLVTNFWNAADELASQSWVNGTYSGSTTFSRNAAGLINGHSATAMGLTVSGSLSYNTQGKLSSVSQTVGSLTRTAGMIYNLNGTVATISYPAGFSVEYIRNGDGQVTAIKKGTTTIASYTYDSAGRLSTRALSNGVTTGYTYDAMDRVTAITTSQGSTTLWAERYGYDAAGRKTHVLSGTSGSVGNSFWLDAIGQLRGAKYGATGADSGYASATAPVSTATWAYDAAGNRQTQIAASGTTGYAVNAINQYTELAGASTAEPTYSARGDLVTQGVWEYTYDAFGNLIQAHNTSSNMLARYWRDSFGHRAVKDVDGNKTVFLNVGTSQLEAYDLAADAAESVIYEPGINRPLAKVDASGNLTFFHQDGHGSIVLLTDASGEKVESYTYDAWGKATGRDASGNILGGSVFQSRWLYAGGEFDGETGLYHLRARAYSSDLGRFLQNDPVDFSGGDTNFLRYCLNSPVDLVDPLGLAWNIDDCFGDVFPNIWGNDAPSTPTPNNPNNPAPWQDPNRHPDGRKKTRIRDTNNSRNGGFGGGGGGGGGLPTFIAGLQLDIIGGTGFTFGLGVYTAPEGTGLYLTAGIGAGLDASLTAGFGAYNSLSNLSGDAFNLNGSGGPVSISLFTSGGNVNGGGISVGPGMSPIGGSATITKTVITPPIRYIPMNFIPNIRF